MIELGAAIRHEFALAEDFLTVNHGSYGATPQAVLDAQDAWRARMEAQPTRFMARELPPALRASAAALAGFIGADADDVVFVENATVGCNAILNALDLQPGDEILTLDHGYGAVIKAARHAASRAGARVTHATLPFPGGDAAACVAAVVAALTPRTRLAVLDHITSASAWLLPVAAMTAACHAAGVPVVIDGAHAPGNIDLDVPSLGAEWYVGNCHKWLCAPKGCGFLWSRRDRQAGVHPVTISHGFGAGYLAEFDWIGTRDMSAWLVLPAALAFHARLGGPALRARNSALAAAGAALLADRLGVPGAHPPGGPHAMGLTRLPVAGEVDEARALALREAFLDRGTDVAVSALQNSAWVRISAAAYNELSDFSHLADILCEVIATSTVAIAPRTVSRAGNN